MAIDLAVEHVVTVQDDAGVREYAYPTSRQAADMYIWLSHYTSSCDIECAIEVFERPV